MRLLALFLIALLTPVDADACSLSEVPSAWVQQPRSGQPPGHRPLITLWMVKKPVAITQVPATCKKDTICKGTAVPFDRTGNYLRPKASLPANARIQVTMDTTLLADATISAGPIPQLPTFEGITFVSAKQEKEGLCSPAGPVVRLAFRPTKAGHDGAVLLVYLEKPDPKQPLAKLAFVAGLGSAREIELGNGLGLPAWLPSVPNQIWVMIADGDGNTGPVIKLP